MFFLQYEFGSEYGSQENLAEGGGTARSGKVKPGARPTAVLPSKIFSVYIYQLSSLA